jgi:hypothetical protein
MALNLHPTSMISVCRLAFRRTIRRVRPWGLLEELRGLLWRIQRAVLGLRVLLVSGACDRRGMCRWHCVKLGSKSAGSTATGSATATSSSKAAVANNLAGVKPVLNQNRGDLRIR